MKIQTIGIDLGKSVFHVIGLDESGKIILRRRFSRTQLTTYLANIPACLIGMEACCGAHYLATILPYARSRRTANAGSVRQAFRESKQE